MNIKKRALSLMLSTTLVVGGIGMSYGTTVYADETEAGETFETVSGGDAGSDGSVSAGDAVPGGTLSKKNAVPMRLMQGTESWEDFTETELVASFAFGTEVTAETIYSDETGFGFRDIEFNNAATGWENSIYYPREMSKNEPGASNVTAAEDCLAIGSKVWTETEETGYGAYTYENTSAFSMKLNAADYQVDVTLVNPSGNAYTAYLEAEDITKVTNIVVEPGKSVKESFTAVLVDGVLDLKFLVGSEAASAEAAAEQAAYVSTVTITRLATNARAEKPTVFIASDSTVQTYEKEYYPQTGWGQTLSLFFGEQIEERECEDCDYSQAQTYEAANAVIENRAIGGRSSKSFVEEGKLDDLLEDIKPGDYLLIQWGHNDATAARPNRYVSSEDFGKWIQYYVDGAKQRGATPVLVTPVARYSYITEADGTLNTFVGNFEAYGNVMRELAAAQNLPLIDLTARSVAICNNFGIEGSKSLFLWVAAGEYPGGNYADGASDSTHLQYYGAYKFAQCVAQGIQEEGLLADLAQRVVITLPENVPGAVTNLKSGSVGATSVSMTWDAREDAELYYIYRQELEEGQTIESVDFTNAQKYSVSAINKYTDSGCKAGTTYVYAVRGFNEKGQGDASEKILVTTKAAGQKFDFNYNNSPTMTGWTGVNHNEMYSAEKGYGWITAPGNGRDRDNNGNADSSDMADDFCLGAGEFAVDLPNGDYEVTVYAGDLQPGTSTIKPSYTAEGLALGGISTKQALGSCTNNVRVVDGQLNLVVGGANQYINGMTITELLKAPSGLTYSEVAVNEENGSASCIISFNQVEEAVKYNVYVKNSTDEKFSVLKSFTVEEYKADDLACRALPGEAGEEYTVYMTCVTADGTESAPSNQVAVSMKVAGDQAAAPQNLRCVSPTADATQLQRFITLEWDKVDGAFKYIIYRSEKEEGDKGFSGFVKVGEVKGAVTYTDEQDVATNISYYYKVAAVTKTGKGKESEICKTPVTGKLAAAAREKYSDRAVVAINLAGADGGETVVTATDKDGKEYTNGVYLSWRSFEKDLDADNQVVTTFDVYRDGSLIADDIKVTNLVDPSGNADSVYKVVGSNDAQIGVTARDTAVWANKYLELSLYCPEDATMPDGTTCDYHANDMSVGDLDGDGVLELIVKWYPSNAKDNSGSGYTGKTYLDGYDVDFATGEAKLLWRIDMGVNIRSGAHYTQFQVWDYDGDGKAEIAVKTADGTTTYKSTDGTVNGLEETGYVGACNSAALSENKISSANDYRNTSGYVLAGPEYFSIFNGEDGTKAAEDVAYVPARGNVSAWGDAYGNRVDRYLSATAYLNGENPFAVFARGYYTRTCLTAYYMKDTNGDGIGDVIDIYWAFDTDKAGTQYEAQGNHGIGVNDIDNDGKDEIIFGALVIDHDGTLKYSTGLGHGDAMHISDWVSWNDGLEIMCVHEHDNVAYHVEIHDAETGKILMGYYTGKDTGRGVAADIDPTAEGGEWWSIASPTYEDNDEPEWDSTDGEVYSTWSTMKANGEPNLIKLAGSTPASNASIFWDGDLLSEIQDHSFNKEAYVPTGVKLYKWNYETEKQEALLSSTEIWSTNGTKGNVGLIVDMLGDWREEIIARSSADKNKVRIYSTTIQTDYVVPCLLENLAYREGVAWENVGYNQPANVSYLLSEGLVTAKLSEGAGTTSDSAEILFTPANDGNLFGHPITGYKVYRAEGDGAFEEIKEIPVGELQKADAAAGGDGTDDGGEETAPAYLKFDFGAGAVKEGWTQVLADTAYTSELGYGFSDTNKAGNNTYKKEGLTDTDSDLYEDNVLFYDKDTTFKEFVVDVPNGTYQIAYTVAGMNVYNAITAEGISIETNKIRFGNAGGMETVNAEVTVEDGQLNLVATISKTGYFNIYFTAIEIKDVNYDSWLNSKEEPDTDEGSTGTDTEVLYTYTDKNLKGNTSYSYKLAAVVDGKASHMSRPVTIKTAISITEVPEIKLDNLVEGTPLAAGATVASLLPATIKVIDGSGAEVSCDVTWDVSEVDINKAGEYTVYAQIKGQEKTWEAKLTVEANRVKGVEELAPVKVIKGGEVKLPEKVMVEYTNTTSEEAAVTWNTDKLDTSAIGTYQIKGTIANFEDVEIEITVNVVENYIEKVAQTYFEIDLGTEDLVAVLPASVNAIWADGAMSKEAVTWDTEGINASEIGEAEVTGAVVGFDGSAKLHVLVGYPAVYRFDFGISAGAGTKGWENITVNPKGGTKTMAELGAAYTEEKGYGFLNPEANFQGRSENYDFVGYLPSSVYTDFAIPDGNTFAVDVENGNYKVELVSGSAYKSTVKSTVEGVSLNVSNAANTYSIGSVEVEVTDGQLTIDFAAGSTSRLDAIIVRKVSPKEEIPGGGEEGEGGDTGDGGDSGSSGDGGDSGDTGEGGDSGNTGDGGDSGDSGDTGDGGDSGEGGDSGNTGDGGDSGSAGDGGSSGDGGNTGEGGNAGESGSTGDGGNTGDGGSTGDGGNTGDSGSSEDSGNTDESDAGADHSAAPEEATVANTSAPAKGTVKQEESSATKNVEKAERSQFVVQEEAGWAEIEKAVDKLIAENAAVEVSFKGYHSTSAGILKAFQNKDAVLRMTQENGIVWEIDGKDIETVADNISMEVVLNGEAISTEEAKYVSGENDYMALSLSHNGDFGFKATMIIPFEKEDNGKFANLFYYNADKEFEFIASCEIADRSAEFVFTHASEYLVVISDAAFKAADFSAEENGMASSVETGEKEAAAEQSAQAESTTPTEVVGESASGIRVILIVIAVIIVGAGAIGALAVRRKKEEE